MDWNDRLATVHAEMCHKSVKNIVIVIKINIVALDRENTCFGNYVANLEQIVTIVAERYGCF